MSCIVIAEAGVNHNGSLETAKLLVDAAVFTGADYVKFQTFSADDLVASTTPKAEYQKKKAMRAETQLEMLKRLELSYNDFQELAKYCSSNGIGFLSTPFDERSISFLSTLSMDFWKIPSGEITNYPYLVKIAKSEKPILLSTGMSTLEEVEDAITVLTANGSKVITLLHCTTEYPAPFAEVNLKAMNALKEKFGLAVGYSDHTEGIVIPIAAVAMGATVIEKHFTLDKNMEGPDHEASLEPQELKVMIDAIRSLEKAMGDGIKQPTESEIKNIVLVRKSIVASRIIKKGEVFSSTNLTTKRPGTGLNPMRWESVIGLAAKRTFLKDEVIDL